MKKIIILMAAVFALIGTGAVATDHSAANSAALARLQQLRKDLSNGTKTLKDRNKFEDTLKLAEDDCKGDYIKSYLCKTRLEQVTNHTEGKAKADDASPERQAIILKLQNFLKANNIYEIGERGGDDPAGQRVRALEAAISDSIYSCNGKTDKDCLPYLNAQLEKFNKEKDYIQSLLNKGAGAAKPATSPRSKFPVKKAPTAAGSKSPTTTAKGKRDVK